MTRRADLVEVSGGLITFGLPRAWVSELFAAISREHFYRDVAKLLGHAVRTDR